MYTRTCIYSRRQKNVLLFHRFSFSKKVAAGNFGAESDSSFLHAIGLLERAKMRLATSILYRSPIKENRSGTRPLRLAH